VTTTTFKSFVSEPFDLALSQPHQMLISSASVAIVAVEASSLVPWPFNIALAVGAEWAYLRGLISGAGVKTRWAQALNISAVALVALYGMLAGFRGFHLIPDAPPWGVAVLLTIIHIGAISAVTLCSAMLHRAGEDAKRVSREKAQQEEETRVRRNQAAEDARNQAWRDAQLTIEIEKQRQQAQLQVEAERERMRAEARAQRRAATANLVAGQPQAQPKIIYDGKEFPSIQAAADYYGITRQAMSKRLRKG
jgi:hypothetical protein